MEQGKALNEVLISRIVSNVIKIDDDRYIVLMQSNFNQAHLGDLNPHPGYSSRSAERCLRAPWKHPSRELISMIWILKQGRSE